AGAARAAAAMPEEQAAWVATVARAKAVVRAAEPHGTSPAAAVPRAGATPAVASVPEEQAAAVAPVARAKAVVRAAEPHGTSPAVAPRAGATPAVASGPGGKGAAGGGRCRPGSAPAPA